jgi:spermidine/putrescine transport system permease protein
MSAHGTPGPTRPRPKVMPVGGELLTAGQLWSRAIITAGPGIVWITLFLILPGLLIFGYSFLTRGELAPAELPVTIDNYARFAGRDAFGDFDPAYWIIVGRSVLVSVVTTVVCVVLAYPLSFFIAAHGPRTRNTLLLLVIAPSWINLVIRTYAWMIVFNPDSPVTSLARVFGIVGEGEGLFPSAFAVYVGMVNVFLPFLVLPLYTAVERLDWSLLEAAQDLYATKWQAFWNVILPQTLPGLVAGIILTVIPAFGMYVVPDLLGGAKTALVGNAIAQQFGQSRDWPFGAAISFLVMSLTLLVLYMYSRRVGEQGMRDLL